MRPQTGQFLERYRVTGGPMQSDISSGFNGAFFIPLKSGETVQVVCSNGGGWDHVSVSLLERCPTWDEMCEVKDLFWSEHEAVIQIHPPRQQYINNHPFCLHLWRPQTQPIPTPPMYMVGILTAKAPAGGAE